jgi:hypothetical protein
LVTQEIACEYKTVCLCKINYTTLLKLFGSGFCKQSKDITAELFQVLAAGGEEEALLGRLSY